MTANDVRQARHYRNENDSEIKHLKALSDEAMLLLPTVALTPDTSWLRYIPYLLRMQISSALQMARTSCWTTL